MLVQATAGGPPPRAQPHALLMDASRVREMGGIHRLGGEISLGVNNGWADILRSSLLRPAAACLADAAALMEDENPGGVLLHALDAAQPENPVLLALTALDARMELAVREEDGRIIHRTLPLHESLQSPPDKPSLPLNVRFAAPFQAAGSALHREDKLSPLQPDARAAAAFVIIDPESGRIATARLALAIPERWPILCPAAETLIGQQPQKETIEAVVRLAQRNCPQPRASSPHFSLVLSSHLIRETLDRAIARSQAT
jgi:CO/xanthine dehydrogenase FAD-binding subunit